MPKHGSWLNIAEFELSVLGRQCLDRRIADGKPLAIEVATLVAGHNAEAVFINWQFTCADARIKLKHLYPVGNASFDFAQGISSLSGLACCVAGDGRARRARML